VKLSLSSSDRVLSPESKTHLATLGETSAKMESRLYVFVLSALLVHVSISFFLSNPFGLELFSDAGDYVTLAKSLATTGEYRLISLPGEPYHTKYPILFPWILSLVWRLAPNFPSNIVYMHWVVIAFSAGFLSLLIFLLPKLSVLDRQRQLLVIGLCALNPALIYASTTIMSEAPYLFFSCLALLMLIELDHRPGSRSFLFLSAICLAFTFLVRVAGIALLGASLLHLALRKKWMDASKLAALTMAILSPWFYWCHIHNETNRFPEYVFNTNYLSDFRQLLETRGVGDFLSKNIIVILIGIPKLLFYPFQSDLRIITYLTAWAGLPILALLFLGFLRCFRGKVNRIVHWYSLVYLAMLLVWPYPSGERFLLPLLPFFYLFVSTEVLEIAKRARIRLKSNSVVFGRWNPRVLFSILLAFLIVAGLLSLGSHAVKFGLSTLENVKSYEGRNKEMIESIQWLREQTQPAESVMAYFYPIYYLHTGRKTAPMSFDPKRMLLEPHFMDTSIRRHGIKYLVNGDSDFGVYTSDVVRAMRRELRLVITSHEGLVFESVFKSEHGKYEIYRIRNEN
jgi:4-amino-4-deoxy-L-arabinose transferase-like glycosyltransferase